MPVYAKPLTLHKGVDNQIQFQFLNQEQKPVDITGKSIVCRILNFEGTEILLSKVLDLVLPATGISVLKVSPSDLEDISAQKCYYSLEIPVGSFDYPVFVDQNAGARGKIDIVDSVLPNFVPSQEVTIPTGQPFPNLSSNTLPNANTYYSSIINTEDNSVLTIQTNLDEYNGNITIQGSTIPDADWYDITTAEYSNSSNTYGYTITGFHPYVRLEFISDQGSVTKILAR